MLFDYYCCVTSEIDFAYCYVLRCLSGIAPIKMHLFASAQSRKSFDENYGILHEFLFVNLYYLGHDIIVHVELRANLQLEEKFISIFFMELKLYNVD